MFEQNSKILVVDDSYTHRTMICDSLRQLGFKNIVSKEGVDSATKALHEAYEEGYSFDIILSDLNMPGLSGLDFLKVVRESELFNKIPFLLITTESEKGAVIQAAMLGVSSYVVKPFSVDSLSKRLVEAYKKHESAA